MEEIKQIESMVIYQNKWMTLREDRIRRSSGAEGIYSVVEKPDFSIIIPVEDDHIYVVEQYRYPVRQRCLELPQGSWNGPGDLSPEEVAKTELREETGLIADKMTYVGELFVAYGYSSQKCHIYLAGELNKGPAELEAEEEGLVTKRIRTADFEQMIKDGSIRDVHSVNAYLLARFKGFL